MADQSTIGFPYYQARSSNNSAEAVTVVFTVGIEGSLGGVSEEDVADAIRDYLAGLSGATSSSLARYSVTNTAL